MHSSTQPLFRQIAALIEESILDGTLPEGSRAPSMNELADFHAINPATARHGLQILVDDGILVKKRGVGTFVRPGARDSIVKARQKDFAKEFVAPLVDEAARLGLKRNDVHKLLDAVAESRGLYR